MKRFEDASTGPFAKDDETRVAPDSRAGSSLILAIERT